MAVSSSSSSARPTQPCWLYQQNDQTQPPVRVALVELPVPLPPLVSYLGTFYIWSDIHLLYLATPASTVQASGRTDVFVSHAANPQF